MISRSLIGQYVWTIDHVRRRVVEVDGRLWTDEDGVTTDRSTIAAVIVGGESLSIDHAVQRLTPWIEG